MVWWRPRCMAIAPRPVAAGIDAPVVGLLAAGPPAFELSAAVCAIARVPVNANAAANARVLSFMGHFLLGLAPEGKTTIVEKFRTFANAATCARRSPARWKVWH